MNDDAAFGSLVALAQKSRWDIFFLLIEKEPGGLPAGDIGSRLGIPPATLSFHLKELAHAGLLQPKRDGRQIIYAPNFPGTKKLLDYLKEKCTSVEGLAEQIPG
jgi:DNA-binding transcriptional ArsR family regulator